MKRYLLLIGAAFISLVLRAQTEAYTCRYWFDQNHAQAATATFGMEGWEAELDVGPLADGLHTLHIQMLAADTVSELGWVNDSLFIEGDTAIMKWSAPQSHMFLKTSNVPAGELAYHYWFDQDFVHGQSGSVGNGQLLLDADALETGLHTLHLMLEGSSYTAAQSFLFLKTAVAGPDGDSYVYHCWFDQDFEHCQSSALGEGHLLIAADSLEEGMHTLHLTVEGSSLTAPQSFLFMKVAPFQADTIDMSHLSYHCWFDYDIEHQQTDLLGDGHILLDANGLDDGIHTVHVMMETNIMASPVSYMFMKMAVEDPTAELQYVCWFDQDYSHAQTGPLGSGIFELDASELTNGLHTVNVQLDKGARTAPQTFLFYKIPLGGLGVARWEYWVNDNFEERATTILSPSADTLAILSLLPVGHPEIRSSCFHFHPNGDAPFINAKNQITFRFWDTENVLLDRWYYYVDEHVEQPIEATVFERNTTKTFFSPRNNQIYWFKMDAGVGDSLSFVASKTCTMQLFAPSGEEVFSVSGPESIKIGGCHAWEEGTYYLAVHDVTGSGETINVTYNWVYRYAVLAYNAHQAGNGGCSTITFQGNGFNSLLDVYLVNVHNDTIRRMDIGHESNTTTTVTFNFYQENLGMYDAVFEFYEESLRIDGAMEVQTPVDIVLSSRRSIPGSYLRGTTNPLTYSFTITNNGNMSAYSVPLYMYISTSRFEDITHVEIDGLNLPSILDYLQVNWDSVLYVDNVIDLRKRVKEFGDDHNFLKGQGDNGSKTRSNFFYVDLAPNESKTISLKLTPNMYSPSLETYITVPNETIPPYNPDGSSGSGSLYCCTQELIQCTLGLVCDGLDVAGLFPTGNAVDMASCICETIQHSNEVMSKVICEGEDFGDAWRSLNARSIVGWATSCANAVNPFSSWEKALDWADKAMGSLTLMDMTTGSARGRDIGEDVSDCVTKWTHRKPDCPPGDLSGGPTRPWYPFEPNEIRGYLSESGSRYMMQEIQTLTYEIESENDTTATGAAHTIIVRDTLDVNKFDVASLAAYRVTIGDKVLELNGEHSFIYTLDLRPGLYVVAQIQQECDPETGIVVWTITSLDPMTMEPTTDPNQGALPINYGGEGIATFTFNINLKEPFDDGTEISNRVGIIFDLEDPVITDTWTNIVDAVKPVSHIEEVTMVADSLNFSFVSSDNRSGVWCHKLYYRNEATEQQWQVKKAEIFGNSFRMPFDELYTTEYLVMAVDSAGNVEQKDMVAEYIHYYEGPGPVTQTDNLSQGWNWWSTYVEMDNADGLTMLENGLGNNGITIKTQDDFVENYYPMVGYDYWYGSLEEVQNEKGYQINVAENCNLTLSGETVTTNRHPIPIVQNWNWIGYPVAVPQNVATALSGFSSSSDDVLKGQFDFTTYYEGFGWYPDDFVLTPGQGYMYQSTSAYNKTLVFGDGGRSLFKPMKKESTWWSTNRNAYRDNLNVMATVLIDSIEQSDGALELGAFVNGECRGSAKLRHFAPTGRHLAMLTVSGNAGESVEFRLVDTETGQIMLDCNDRLTFTSNAVVGSLDVPYPVHFDLTGTGCSGSNMSLYPNPVDRGQSFSLKIPQQETITEIIVTDMLGEVIRYETGALDVKSIQGLPSSGVYVIEAVARSGNRYHGRLIVK